ncbi:hypothetical protein AC579_2167 [Pseudocercospora musae]|uniref:Uncharacterized protein n=1 Tax=Pseudocercospora musae TaxID=113226 RepID=A0A139IEM8_9PEZI|nr:hypothetical protein AC579_2167 [Pseudocercospora musae]
MQISATNQSSLPYVKKQSPISKFCSHESYTSSTLSIPSSSSFSNLLQLQLLTLVNHNSAGDNHPKDMVPSPRTQVSLERKGVIARLYDSSLNCVCEEFPGRKLKAIVEAGRHR